MKEEFFVRGDKIHKITTIRNFKKMMVNLFKGYPTHIYWGIIESYFKENAKEVVDILYSDGLIDFAKNRETGEKIPLVYRLTPKGVDFAVSMINLEYSERMLKYSRDMKKLTIWIIILSTLTFILSGLIFYFNI